MISTLTRSKGIQRRVLKTINGSYNSYPWTEMEVGDWFRVRSNGCVTCLQRSVSNSAVSWAKNRDVKFRTYQKDESVICERIQ